MLHIAAVLCCALLVSGDVIVPIGNHWSGGFQGKACLPVTQTLHGWKVRLVIDQPITSLEAFTATLLESSADKTEFVVGSMTWNAEKSVGDQVCIDFMGHADRDIQPVVTAYFDGEPGDHSHAPTQVTGAQGTGVGGQTVTTTAGSVHVQTDYGEGVTSTLHMMNDWGERFQGSFSFPLAEDAIGWMVNMTFSSPVTRLDIDSGEAISHSPDGLNWVVVDKADRAYVPKGTFTLSYYANRGPPVNTPLTGSAVFVNLGIDRTGHVDPLPNTAGSKYNYDDVLMKSIMFYEAQRSGKLPANNRIPWRGDSALGDHGDNGVDLTGGWYDAGDHIKFNYPMAYSTLVLTWGLLEFPDAYEAAGQTAWMYDCIKWPLDYLLKCYLPGDPADADDDVLYVQVGDGGPDHSYWGRPEDMTMARPAYKVDAAHPGCDISMEQAAAFAAGYMAFKDRNATYANTLLERAKELWRFAVAHKGLYSSSVSAAAGFYRSYNFTDEMCWGSMWMYKATQDQQYLTEARKWFDTTPDWGMSWDDKIIGCQILMYNLTGDASAKTAVEGTFRDWLPGGSIPYTPKGLAWRLQWGSLRYSSNMAMTALIAAESGIHTAEYRHWAMCQIHYALGDTGFSYVIGYGNQSWPLRPHHRSSSCPLSPAPCGSSMMSSKSPNPHTLYGALVGGPDQSDGYSDARDNYVNNEVACDYNAGFQTAVAALRHLWIVHEHPEQTGDATCPYASTTGR